ncbi:MAG TPA: metalloregulator ArsR/SmtB family transcription factor [Beijerinckiaceae bacterium]|nr:metalloregulator ArsR/SmtB family transcription factor [Beijerinckiaceae bacterium]
MPASLPFPAAISALEAAGEPTRLRILALVSQAELTVTELMAILGQSQPRVSRHLKLLVEAGLVERHKEGAWAFFRRSDAASAAMLAGEILRWIDPGDVTVAEDRRRLAAVRSERARQAAQYFAQHAEDWGRIRAMHVPESRVEAAILDILGDIRIEAMLDIGTGTGRMLEILAPRARRAVGLDVSPAMLAVARANLERAGIGNVQLRQGDAYALAPGEGGFNLIVIHQVLHFLDDPVRAVREAARLLAPGGRLLIADLAPHADERLRSQFNHRRLGFAPEEIASVLRDAGLEAIRVRALKPLPGEGDVLTVMLWLGKDSRIQTDAPFSKQSVEVA